MPRIALFLAIPRDREFAPIGRSPLAAARIVLRRRWEELHWLRGDTGRVTRYVWERCSGSNKGDIGIREAVIQQLRGAFPAESVAISEIGWGTLDEQTVERINREHDIFVLGGSGYLALDAEGRLEDRNARDILMMEKIRIPKVAYGIGLNYWLSELPGFFPITDPRSCALLTGFLDGLSLVAVRDLNTAAQLGKLTTRPVRLIGDPALFLEPAAPRPARPPPLKDGILRIGLNLALHENGMMPLFREVLPQLVRFCQLIAAGRQIEFVYFVHAEVEYLVPRLLRRHGIMTTVIDTDPATMIAHYALLDLHVSQMLHSAIFALAGGVPTINLAYDVKALGFFKLMNLERYAIPAAEATGEALFRLSTLLLAEAKDLRGAIAARKAAIAKEVGAFRGELAALGGN